MALCGGNRLVQNVVGKERDRHTKTKTETEKREESVLCNLCISCTFSLPNAFTLPRASLRAGLLHWLGKYLVLFLMVTQKMFGKGQDNMVGRALQ